MLFFCTEQVVDAQKVKIGFTIMDLILVTITIRMIIEIGLQHKVIAE